MENEANEKDKTIVYDDDVYNDPYDNEMYALTGDIGYAEWWQEQMENDD